MAVVSSTQCVRVVSQRIDSAELLIDNKEQWIRVGKGLIFYISFREGVTLEAVTTAVRSLLRAPLATLGLWGDDARSVLWLASQGHQVDICVVPQASLTSESRELGHLHYRMQASKDTSAFMYERFVALLTEEAQRALFPPPPQQLSAAELATLMASRLAVAAQDPKDMFRTGTYEGKYGAYDERGVPTHDAAGVPITSSQAKKLEKLFATRLAKFRKIHSGGHGGIGCSKGARPSPSAASSGGVSGTTPREVACAANSPAVAADVASSSSLRATAEPAVRIPAETPAHNGSGGGSVAVVADTGAVACAQPPTTAQCEVADPNQNPNPNTTMDKDASPKVTVADGAREGLLRPQVLLPRVVCGTFGNRQGLRLDATCGPFSHIFFF